MSTQAEIIVREGPRALGHYILDPGEYVIGREMSCDILLDSLGVSRQHAKIIVTPERLLVRDLGSTNGTFLGENPVEGSVPVPSGDVIHLGTDGSVELKLLEGKKATPSNGKGHEDSAAQNEELKKALADAQAERKKREELSAQLTAMTRQRRGF